MSTHRPASICADHVVDEGHVLAAGVGPAVAVALRGDEDRAVVRLLPRQAVVGPGVPVRSRPSRRRWRCRRSSGTRRSAGRGGCCRSCRGSAGCSCGSGRRSGWCALPLVSVGRLAAPGGRRGGCDVRGGRGGAQATGQRRRAHGHDDGCRRRKKTKDGSASCHDGAPATRHEMVGRGPRHPAGSWTQVPATGPAAHAGPVGRRIDVAHAVRARAPRDRSSAAPQHLARRRIDSLRR